MTATIEIENLVIGSGPTGIAAASALLEAGRSVCLIDGGVTLEPEVAGRIETLHGKAVEAWNPEDLVFLRDKLRMSDGGFDTKLSYGSDFPYRWADPTSELQSQQRPAIKASFAPGGLSQVWGAGVLPFSRADLAGWPITYEQLAPHFAPVLRLLPYAADPGDLDGEHPLHSDAPLPGLTLSRASQSFLARARRNRDRLRSRGMTVVPTRLAVKSRECRYCRLCLYGCPDRLIWSADTVIADLAQRYGSRFRYETGWVAETLAEDETGVLARCSRRGGEAAVFRARKVFVGAGVLQTTRILIASLGRFDEPVPLKDSQYFVFPYARWARTPGVTRERLFTLAQLFIKLDRAVPFPALISVYSHNDSIAELLRARFRFLGPLSGAAANYLSGRLLIFAGYLHSELSSSLEFRLAKAGRTVPAVTVASRIRPEAAEMARRVVRGIAGAGAELGGVPLTPLLQISDPGTAYHYGGSFPMTETPRQPFESDSLGRPPAFRKVFVVDASSFPTVPASTITINAMANAHRIATQAAGLAA